MPLPRLVNQNEIKKALIVDDAYDVIPEAEDLTGLDLSSIAKALGSESPPIREELGEVLASTGLAEDEFEDGLGENAFIEKLWQLSEAGQLTATSSELLFAAYKAEQEQKRAQLLPLEGLLNTLNLQIETQGRRHTQSLPTCNLLFLDLFLGVTDSGSALNQAIARIKRIVEAMDDEKRPLVIVMSTKSGIELSKLAGRLQREASLLGCKFRTASKTDFEHILPAIIEQLLKDYPNSQMVAKWLDAWKAAINSANALFINKLRSLDLSDYAYLQKYRLDAEGVQLGEYLRPALSDFFSYCVEESRPLAQQSAKLDLLSFEQPPNAHFLPSERVTEISHARTFLNRVVLEESGFQVHDVMKSLQLGDVIVKRPPGHSGYDFSLENLEVLVVITQACDIQQRNTDTFLMLKGVVHRRDWTADLSPLPTRTDVFMWNNEDYSLDWEKAKVASVTASTLQNRLSPTNGSHARIARFRDLEALRIQSLFASNLTRIGTAVGLHHRAEVGIEFWAKGNDGPVQLFKADVDEKMAALINGRMLKEGQSRKSEATKFLVFDRVFPEMFADTLQKADFSRVTGKIPDQLTLLAKSNEDLNGLRAPHKLPKPIAIGPTLKAEIKWNKLPENWTGNVAFIIKPQNFVETSPC